MEQKTEASQAVDELITAELMNRIASKHMGWVVGVGGWADAMQAIADDLRAALKAQPAPAESQGDPYAWSYECRQPFTDPVIWAEFIGRDKPTKNDPKWTRNAKPLYEHPGPAEAAQGEDSARLDWIEKVVKDKSSFVALPCGEDLRFVQVRSFGGCENYPTASGVREAIDRARASAETGGVKP